MRTALAAALCLLAAAASAQDAAVRQPAEAATAPPGDLAEDARLFAAAVQTGDPEAAAALFDAEGYFERALADLDPAYAEGVRRGAEGAVSFPEQVAAEVAAGGSYAFLRLAERGGEPRARFRFVDAGGGLNYHDVLLVRGADGVGRFRDVYTFTGGEDLSRSVRRLLGGYTGASGGPPGPRGLRIAELTAAAQRGDHWTVVETYPRIEPRDEDAKPLLVLYLTAAAAVSPADYTKALELFQRDFAGDPTADLVLIDRHYLRGDFDGVLAAVDRLDAGVGGDPYLDLYRARAHLDAGRLDEAQAAADQLAASLPDVADVLFLRLDVAVVRGDYAAVTALMLRLEREFAFEFAPEVLKRDPLWAGFVASPQYKVWAAERRR